MKPPHGVYAACVTEEAQELEVGPRNRSGRRRPVFVALYVLFLLLLAEGGARGFWRARGVPFWTAHKHIYQSFYPGVASLERIDFDADEDCFDILLLGGSVLHCDYGDIAHVLRERLIRETHACVNVHNLAEPAHTTLDSLYKYKHLAGKAFDLVVVYQGINEVRANNTPAAMFREDYSHFSWYKLLNDFEARTDARWFALPYTIEFVALKGAGRMGLGGFLPTHEPRPESMEHGCEVKTTGTFRRNLEGVLDLARVKGEAVLLMTFAYHLPADYTREAFDVRSLDYSAHAFPVELWGKPECVVKALDAQNLALTSLVENRQEVYFVDQNALIPREGLYFNDICHFTHEGSERFVENLLPEVRRVFAVDRSR